MFFIEVLTPTGKASSVPLDMDWFDIGTGEGCRVRVADPAVAKCHARISRHVDSGKYFILDLGSARGTEVNGESIVRYGPLGDSDVISIGSHKLKVLPDALMRRPPAPPAPAPASPAPTAPAAAAASRPAAAHAAKDNGHAARPATPAGAVNEAAHGGKSVGGSELDPQTAEMAVLAEQIHQALFVALDLRRNDVNRMNDAELRELTQRLIGENLDRGGFPSHIDREKLASYVLNEAVGLGALESLISDESITEIMVNGQRDVFVERSGRLQRAPVVFSSDKTLFRVIERIVAPIGRRVDESSPLVDARLRDGSRVNIVIPPLALKGPTITIRKFSKRRLEVEDLVGFGSVSTDMVNFLKVCVEQKKNIVVSGGTGSGKTTLLNVLSNLIPQHERIVTIEDAAELRLHHDNLVTLEARPKNLEGKGAVAIRDLVKNALRMRPDRIVVGECRGGEALDMLQAMNTGHDGSLTTAHANSPRDCLSRLEVMVLMAGMDLPVAAIREQIASAVQVIVQQTRFACGSRKITRIAEVTGVDHGTIQMQELFRFERTGFDANGKIQGYFTGCGQVPTFYEEVQRAGVPLELSVFTKRDENGVPCRDEEGEPC
jgi:pilus assembly protein CpaF